MAPKKRTKRKQGSSPEPKRSQKKRCSGQPFSSTAVERSGVSKSYAPGRNFDTAPVPRVSTLFDQNPDQEYMERSQLQSPNDSARMEVTTIDVSRHVYMNPGHTGGKQIDQTILPLYPARHISTTSMDIPNNNKPLYDLSPDSTNCHSPHQTNHSRLFHSGTSTDIFGYIDDRSDLLESSKHMSEEIDAQDRAINHGNPCQSTNTSAYQHHRVSAREDQLKKVDLALTTNPCPWPGCLVKDRNRQRLKEHLRRNHLRCYQCKHCPFRQGDSHQIKRHQRREHEDLCEGYIEVADTLLQWLQSQSLRSRKIDLEAVCRAKTVEEVRKVPGFVEPGPWPGPPDSWDVGEVEMGGDEKEEADEELREAVERWKERYIAAGMKPGRRRVYKLLDECFDDKPLSDKPRRDSSLLLLSQQTDADADADLDDDDDDDHPTVTNLLSPDLDPYPDADADLDLDPTPAPSPSSLNTQYHDTMVSPINTLTTTPSTNHQVPSSYPYATVNPWNDNNDDTLLLTSAPLTSEDPYTNTFSHAHSAVSGAPSFTTATTVESFSSTATTTTTATAVELARLREIQEMYQPPDCAGLRMELWGEDWEVGFFGV